MKTDPQFEFLKIDDEIPVRLVKLITNSYELLACDLHFVDERTVKHIAFCFSQRIQRAYYIGQRDAIQSVQDMVQDKIS